MKKIVIILAFIFVGMANAMQTSFLDGNAMQRLFLDDNDMQLSLLLSFLDDNNIQYEYNGSESDTYLEDIQDLYNRIKQKNVQSRTKEAVQSDDHTDGPGIKEIFSFLEPVQNPEQDLVNIFGLHGVKQIDHSKKPSLRNPYLARPENNDERNEISAPLILDLFQEVSVGNVEGQREERNEKSNSKKRTFEEAASSDENSRDFPEEFAVSKEKKAKTPQDRATVDRQEKKIKRMQSIFLWKPEEKRKSKKRKLKEATASDEKNRDKQPVVLNTKKRAPRKKSSVPDICGINGCLYRTTRSMKDHKGTPHEQKQCPYPGCIFQLQSRGELLQHIKENHPEKCCTVCGYTPKKRDDFLKHLQRAKHGSVSKNPAFINFKLGEII
jgi:hypothetical protein